MVVHVQTSITDTSIQVPCNGKVLALCTDIPYQVGTVGHATNNKMAKITFVPYQAGMVNHAIIDKTAKITDTIFVWYMWWAPSTTQMKKD